uniref:Phosphate transporter n=1 Tax=Steinernema glaseri TaxID=37863 RepID=A0A1I7ZNR6_9BILA
MDIVTAAAMGALETFQTEMYWTLVVGVVIAFILAFAIGANDTANSFGTSVGSGALTLVQAYVLAAIFETLGAMLLGYRVTDTMRKGVIDLAVYEGRQKELMFGQVSVLSGCGIWLIVATLLELPVSTTHSIVGATLGYSILLHGFEGINPPKIYKIFASWIVSPLLAGFFTIVFFLFLEHSVLRRKNPFNSGMRILPLLYFLCVVVNVFAVVYKGSSYLGFDKWPLWLVMLVSAAFGLVAALIAYAFVGPRVHKTIMEKHQNTRGSVQYEAEADSINLPTNKIAPLENPPMTKNVVMAESGKVTGRQQTDEPESAFKKVRKFFRSEKQEDTKTAALFTMLQIVTACFGGFAHGGNDVSNAIAPLVSIFSIYRENAVSQKGETPVLFLFLGSVGMCVGLFCLGHRVIRTVGSKLTNITPTSGFAIELGAAVTVLFASKLGLPISSTQCKVGSIVAMGFVQKNRNVDMKTFRNIALSWVVTLPVAGALSAGVMFILKMIYL